MTTTYAQATATEAQIKFVQSLLTDREVEPMYARTITTLITQGELTKHLASRAIEFMKGQPYRVKFTPVETDTRRQRINEVLETIPMARYAIPTSELPAMFSQRVNGDLLFVRVSKYRNRFYFARLHGAPGAFTTSRLGMSDVLMLAVLIQSDALRFTQLFAKHHSVCGACGAELTDQTSRELGLGPVCRKAFGA